MRTRNGFLGAVVALAALAVAPAAAHAGSMTLYSSIQGAGSVVNSAGPAYSCDATAQQRNTDVHDCGTKAYTADPFAVSITLKATPKAGWKSAGWDGCPEVTKTGECTIDGPVWSRGYYTVRAKFVDAAGPNLTIDGISINADDSVTGWFHADEQATFECLAPGLVWVPCSSGWVHPPFPPQDYTYEVRATDINGQSTTARRVVRIFDTRIYSAPVGYASTRQATVTFGGTNNPEGYQCSIDGGAWFACASPYAYDAGGEGPHTFRVRGMRGGEVDPYPAIANWTVDTVAPETTITAGPPAPGPVRDTSATLWFSSPSDPGSATYECRLDGGMWFPCTSPRKYDGLAQGPHIFDVRAKDAAGNIDPTPASRLWTVDTVAPVTSFTGGPSEGEVLADGEATFEFAADDRGATFECRLDGGAWEACASPHALTALAAGAHELEVRATDPVGNVEATPASRAFTVAAPQGGGDGGDDGGGGKLGGGGGQPGGGKPGGGGGQHGNPSGPVAPRITGARKLSVRADRRGRITLARVRVVCPAGGKCRVTGTAKRGAARTAQTLKARTTTAVRAKLSRAALATLRAKGRVVIRVKLTATGPGGRASRAVTVTVMRR